MRCLLRNVTLYSINVWPFSHWPCYMPEILIMAEDGCNGPGQRRAPLQPSEAIINIKGIKQGQYEKGHILILLSTNFNRKYSVGMS